MRLFCMDCAQQIKQQILKIRIFFFEKPYIQRVSMHFRQKIGEFLLNFTVKCYLPLSLFSSLIQVIVLSCFLHYFLPLFSVCYLCHPLGDSHVFTVFDNLLFLSCMDLPLGLLPPRFHVVIFFFVLLFSLLRTSYSHRIYHFHSLSSFQFIDVILKGFMVF